MKHNFPLPAFHFLLFAFLLPGCDFLDSRALDRERADSIYQAAMADYTAGRLEQAIGGLNRVVRATPGNSSARFQLACLLQDFKKDYLGAICNYREFLAQDRTGEKSAFAKDRLAQCERLLGPELLKKYDQGAGTTLTDENAALKAQLAALEKTRANLEKRLERALVRAEESASESERMRKMLVGEVAEDAAKPKIQTEAGLLDEEGDGREDRIKFSKDAKELIVEDSGESEATPYAVTERKPSKVAEKKPTEPPHEPRPAEYVVREGDTLYGLAMRFYGYRAAWTRIREANKAVVSNDGRIKAGQRLVLP